MFENVKGFDLEKVSKLPCGCKAKNGEFKSVWI